MRPVRATASFLPLSAAGDRRGKRMVNARENGKIDRAARPTFSCARVDVYANVIVNYALPEARERADEGPIRSAGRAIRTAVYFQRRL